MIVLNSAHKIDSYSRCLSASGYVGGCKNDENESWTVAGDGALISGARCMSLKDSLAVTLPCTGSRGQRWNYDLYGNLVNAENGQCLTAADMSGKPQSLRVAACGHNQPDQIWSLPN